MNTLQLKDFELYNAGKVIAFETGDSMLVRDLIQYASRTADVYHIVQQGDTITYIAWIYYRNLTENAPKYWRYISDANGIINPMDISQYIGKPLIIPDFHSIKLEE